MKSGYTLKMRMAVRCLPLRIAVVCMTGIILHSSTQGRIWRVPQEGITIKEAVEDSAIYGDTVLVAPGIYDTTSGETFPIHMKNGVVLISEKGRDSTIIDACYTERVIECKYTDSTTMIAGFTITHGAPKTPAAFLARWGGGGIYCDSSSTKIIDNKIVQNIAGDSIWDRPGYGAGILCYSSASEIRNNIISNNIGYGVSFSRGGGIACYGPYANSDTCIITGNTIVNNKVGWGIGGGIYSDYKGPTFITKNLIKDNEAADGGGILSVSSIISSNIILNNEAYLAGGGIAAGTGDLIMGNTIRGNSADDGGGIWIPHYYNAVIKRNIITHNVAIDGGGIYCEGHRTGILSNVIGFNTAKWAGGGIFNRDGEVNISSNTIICNISGRGEGAICWYYCSKESDFSSAIVGSNAVIDNNTAIRFEGMIDTAFTFIGGNNFYYNTYQAGDYEILNFSPQKVLLADNFWWFTDSMDIDSLIYGLANFIPFLPSPSLNTPGEPSIVHYVKAMSDSTYTALHSGKANIGDTLYIQLKGADWKASYFDPAVVIIRSRQDTYGIAVALIETDTATGIYQGVTYVDTISNDMYNKIGVNSNDMIIIKANVDRSKHDTVFVGEYGIVEENEKVKFGISSIAIRGKAEFSINAKEGTSISLNIYDAIGRVVKRFKAEKLKKERVIVWDGRNEEGLKVPSGVYFVRLTSDKKTKTRKAIMVR